MRKHFLEDAEADHYDRSRPYFHPLVFVRLTQLLPDQVIERALDVACGTGQSTEAMAAVSKSVIGLDPSEAMLRRARGRGFRCVRASAEYLPFRENHFDLVGIGLAFHWFDRIPVLQEVRRVLKPGRWLLIFTSGFVGSMQENADFANWHKAYLARFPTPPRNSAPLPTEAITVCGFRAVASERFSHAHTYSQTELVAYLTTQTNVTAAVAGKTETMGQVRDWLNITLQPFFLGEQRTFDYAGSLSLLQKVH
jgi:SAM-dependent methyltransferase